MSTFKPDIVVPREWIGVDFNRTLAEYHSYHDDMLEAKPLAPMVERVKQWLAEGKTVKILSAQVWYPEYCIVGNMPKSQVKQAQTFHDEAMGYFNRAYEAEQKIRAWCLKHLGQELEVTCERDPGCKEVWDDKAVNVIRNLGIPTDPRRQAKSQPGMVVVYDEVGPWPPAENVMGWVKGNMSGVSTFTDAEIERTYWRMIARRAGLIVDDELTPAAQTLLAYTREFHKPPTCAFPQPDSDTTTYQPAQPDEASA